MYIYVYIMYICTCIGGFFPKRPFHERTFSQKIFSWANFWGKFMGRGCCTWRNLRSDDVKGGGGAL